MGRPRVITARVAQRIRQYTQDQPGLYSWEIRDRLLHDNICSSENIPSLSSINRLLRKKDIGETSTESRSRSSYTIASILDLSSSGGKSPQPASLSAASCLDSHVEGINDQQKQTENVPEFEGSYQEFSIEEIQFPLQTQKKDRIKYNQQQLNELEAAFAVNQYPSASLLLQKEISWQQKLESRNPENRCGFQTEESNAKLAEGIRFMKQMSLRIWSQFGCEVFYSHSLRFPVFLKKWTDWFYQSF